jgi:hypothetical protein
MVVRFENYHSQEWANALKQGFITWYVDDSNTAHMVRV